MPERGSKTSTVPVVWATFGIFSARFKWFPVASGDHGRNLVISLRPGDKATINGVAALRLTPPQNIPSAKIRWKRFRLDFFGTRTASSSLIIFQRAKLLTRGITHLCWCNWRTFWRKNAARRSPRGVLFLHNAPAHRALATQKKLTYLGFQCLDHPPYSPDLAPSDYHLYPGLKKRLKGRHFSADAEIIAAAVTWLEGQFFSSFFEYLAKVRATG